MTTASHPACDLPGLPRDEQGPVFSAPWQAQAFALALALHERGAFTWPEWAAALSAAIARAQAAGDPDAGDTYYQHWLDALETLVIDPGTAPRLIPRIPDGCVAVAESGMTTVEDVRPAAAAGADAILVGSAISAAADPVAAVASLASLTRRPR